MGKDLSLPLYTGDLSFVPELQRPWVPVANDTFGQSTMYLGHIFVVALGKLPYDIRAFVPKDQLYTIPAMIRMSSPRPLSRTSIQC